MLIALVGTVLGFNFQIMYPSEAIHDEVLRPVQSDAKLNPATIVGRAEYYSHDGCTQLPPSKTKPKNNSLLSLIVVLEEGNCSISTKASHAVKRGASALIVISNLTEIKEGKKAAAIPVLLANKGLADLMKKYPGTEGTFVMAELVIDGSAETVQPGLIEVKVWGAALHAHTYQLYENLFNILEVYEDLNSTTAVVPRFALVDCTKKGVNCKLGFLDSCICKGKVCSVKEQGDLKIEFIDQELRMMAVLKERGLKDFETYVRLYSSNCLEFGCSNEEMSKLLGYSLNFVEGYSNKAKSCKGQEFEFLETSKTQFVQLHQFPVLEIGGKVSRAKQAVQIMHQLCKEASRKNLNLETCEALHTEDSGRWEHKLMVLGGVVALVLVGFWVYRRKYGDAARRQMKMEINSAVSNYFQFQNDK